ncbi:hypothetical protein M569_02500 [Genlisea aurea]|uniref:Uncharacterized protein n=1 Tax=Genlisea aurea TaxID=192259 RepID=S8E8Q1_9LAMI|nr:hypothetical protein M569_02500 [Genlisea aurea]
MATPGGTRPENFPPNYNPNAIASGMQNLHINQPNQQPVSNLGGIASRPPGAAPFGQQPPSFTGGRPGPPPPGVYPGAPVPPNAATLSQNTVANRPLGPPSVSQPPSFIARPPPPGALPSSFSSPAAPSPFALGPRPGSVVASSALQPPIRASSIVNGPAASAPRGVSTGPGLPTPLGSVPGQFGGPPQMPNIPSSRPFSQPPQAPPRFGSPPAAIGQPGPPFLAPPPPVSSPFPAHALPASHSPYGMLTMPPQTQQVVPPPPIPGPMQQARMVGMPPVGPPFQNQPASLNQTAQSRIDPNQIPRFSHSSSVILHETRQGNQANPPPPATSDYIVRDTGNCSPRYMRCTINQIPCTADLLSTSAMQLALLVQPLALPHPSEEPIQVVDFGERGPVRCSRCKSYINPFMKFIDQGRKFICNFCGFTDETPRDYHCNLGPDGRRRDADERPELCTGTVEFVASKEYMVRDPMPAVFFFLIDVSSNAIQTGATAAACSAISQVIPDLPEGPRTMVGIATFDSTVHFYNLKRNLQQPLMLIVPDVQDVYTPLESDIIVRLSECREQLDLLLESIPTMFLSNRIADSAFGAAVKAAFLALKATGGKLLVFQSVLPSIGIGSLSGREAEGKSSIPSGDKEAHKLLQPADKILKTMAIEFAEYQVCVDLFITTQTYADIASLSVIPRTTGGQVVYYYHPFSALSDPAKLYNDLRWNVTRPQGFEAVMRVRCSQGIQVQEYSGNFCRRIPTDVDLPAIDCDKAILVSLKYDDKLQEGTECSFQCALLYTTVYGHRRIRVSTLSLPCTNMLSNLFRSADLDTQFACILKQAANEIPTSPLVQARDQAMNICINILYSYRKFCSTVSTSGQLILPEALKLLPLYALAMLKSIGLRSDGRLDDRSYWVNNVSRLPVHLVIPLVYPRMIAIHDLDDKDLDDSVIPPPLPLLSSEISNEGIYLLENSEECLIFVGSSVSPKVVQQLFGSSSLDDVPDQFVLPQLSNPPSKKLNAVVNEIRRQRCSYLRMRLCRQIDPLAGSCFFLQMLEDTTNDGVSYIDFLVHIHRQIQTKMA